MPSNFPIFQIDTFTTEVFKGNPAAVVPLDDWISEESMQHIAAENNLAETAFFIRNNEGAYEIRWFTPTSEIDLCGHATLASAYVLWKYYEVKKETITFQTKQVGSLSVHYSGNDLFTLDLPTRKAEKLDKPSTDFQVLFPGAIIKEVHKSRDYLLVFETPQEVMHLQPNFTQFADLDATGCICTAPGEGHDFISRCFYPAVGIPEDPVTGSAHCTLIPYWSERLGKKDLKAYQASVRGGELWCTYEGSHVLVAGKAVTYMKGVISL